jgi:hypothetical protein
MPIFVTMAFSHESEQPGRTDGDATSGSDPLVPGDAGVPDGITPERLQQIIRRLESGFYDSPEVREQIARRVRKELDE